MNESTLVRMNQMKLYGMHGAFKTAIETGKTDHYTIDQFMAMLIQAEWDDRNNRKTDRMVKNARFHYNASVEEIIYDDSRNINRNSIIRLADCEYIKQNENLLITGSTGVGKSYIATALGYQACIEGYRVMYFNTTKLFAKLKMAKADGSYLKEMAKLERQHLIILDDFGLQPLDNQNQMILMELIEDRNGKGSVMVTSQIPVKGWYNLIGEKTIADAIMDRLVHQSHRIELSGESMRRKKKIISGEKS
jgi:DNA replication protein DnaC